MFDYTGCKCPVCQQRFVGGDDVVVCPDCGAPYHRSCYHEHATCVFADRHAPDFEWKPAPGESIHAEAPDPAVAATDTNERACPHCGAMNPDTALFCESCGYALPQIRTAKATPTSEAPQNDAKTPASYGPNSAQKQNPFALPDLPEEYQLSPDEEIDGIAAHHWASFLGPNAPFYLFSFKRIASTGQKIGASFSAFLFGPFYFIYRKMWLQGGIFLLFTALLSWAPSILRALIHLNNPLVAGLDADVMNVLSNVTFSLQMVMKFLLGTFAVYWYQKSASKRIRQILEQVGEANADTALAKKGGVSLTALVVTFLSVFAILFVIIYLLLFAAVLPVA